MKKAAKKRGLRKASDLGPIRSQLMTLPIPALVGTVDMMVGILRERGVVLQDWDDHQRGVYGFRILGGKAFVLLTKNLGRGGPDDGTERKEA